MGVTKVEATKLVKAALDKGHILKGQCAAGAITAGPISQAVFKGTPRFGCYIYGKDRRFASPDGKIVGEGYGTSDAAYAFVEYMGRGDAAKVAREALGL